MGQPLGWNILLGISRLQVVREWDQPQYFQYVIAKHVIHSILCVSIGSCPPSDETQDAVDEWVEKNIEKGNPRKTF